MLRTGRFSASSGHCDSYIAAPLYGAVSSPRHSHSPRHSRFLPRKTDSRGAVLAQAAVVAAVLGLILLLGSWRSLPSAPSTAVEDADPISVKGDCAGCTHGRSTKAEFRNSDLTMKMGGPSGTGSRGRKDFYADVEVHPDGNRGKLSEQQPLQDNASAAPRAAQQQQPQPQQVQPPAAAVGFRQQRPILTRPLQQPGSQPRRELLQQQQPRQPQQQQQQQQQKQQQQQAAPVTSQPGQQQPAGVAVPMKPLDSATVAAATRSLAGSGAAMTDAGAAAAGVAAIQPVTGAGTAAAAAAADGGTVGRQAADPLHDDSAKAAKEAAQLAALSRVVQQQQDTISRQAQALMDLQKRFVQQERQLQASLASAAGSNASEGADVEPYFPKERVQLEQDMLHKVEAQIEEVSASVVAATQALPQLSKEQQAAQVQQLMRADQLMGRLSRVAAAISLRTNDPLTESGHDPVAELRHYYGTVASNNVTLSWQEALARQSRPTSAQLGIAHVEPYSDAESDLESLDVRLEYALAELTGMNDDAPCHIGMVTTWSGDLWGIRREMLPWITYHAQLGVSKIYVLYDGNDRNTHTALLDLHPYVRVILASAPLASANETEEFAAWLRTVPDSHIKEWSSQPGNYQLMTKQGFAATKALELARQDHVSWLIHMDPDELLHPAAAPTAGDLGGAFSLLPELCGAPDTVPSIRFINVEAVPEAADIINRYEQVTLFRAHRHLVQPGAQPYRYIFKQGHADAWLHLYTNGKSAVRPDAPGVTQGGPHVFLGPADKRWVTPDNPHGLWHPAISNSTLVLHYAYTTPGDVAVKAGRSCPESVVEAVLAGDVAQASRCFVLDIDQRAFLAAIKDRKAAGVPVTPPALPAAPPPDSSGPVRELLIDAATMAGIRTSSGFSNASWPVGKEVLDFFWGELALSEGAPFECLTPDGQAKGWCAMSNAGHLKSLLISSGLMLRLHAPAQAMKGIEAAIEQLLMVTGRAAAKPVAPGSVVGLPVHDAAAGAAAWQGVVQQQGQQQLATERKLLQAVDPAAAAAAAAAASDTDGAPWEHRHHSNSAAQTATTASVAAAAPASSSSGATEEVRAELPKEGSAAATDVLLHNDDAALSRDEHAEERKLHRKEQHGSSHSQKPPAPHSQPQQQQQQQQQPQQPQEASPSSQGAATAQEVAKETGVPVEEAAAIMSLTDAISKDVAQQAAEHAKSPSKHSAIRDKMLLT